MNQVEATRVDENLIEAWNRTLSGILNSTDSTNVKADALDPHTLRIFIQTAGHTKYAFEFKCSYVDDREVQVHLMNAHKGNGCAEEATDIVEQLAHDYIRHIHECAQALQTVTHA